MKKIIKRFWGVGLIVIILSSLFVVASPVSAADPLRWEAKTGGPSAQFNAITSYTTYDYAVTANGATLYAACGSKLLQSTGGGTSWTDITTRLPAGYGTIYFVALAPDDPNIVVVITTNTTGTAGNYVAISVNGGVTFTDMAFPTLSTQTVLDVQISALVSGGFRYIAVIGGHSTPDYPILYYYNYGSGVGAWKNALSSAYFTGSQPSGASTMDNIVALAFSPNFASDYMAVALSEQIGSSSENGTLRLHVLSFNSLGWDTTVASGYPVLISGTNNAAFSVRAASIALGPDYMGGDETLRMAFVGADVSGNTSGIWRCNDSTAARSIFDTTGIYSVAYDGTNLAAGAYGTNNVYHCADPLGASPTVVGARNLKKIGVDASSFDDKVKVAFVGSTLFGSKQGTGAALSKSLDAGNTWNDFTLIKMSLTNLDDILVSADGATWYLSVRDGSLSAIFRMSPMQRVLCVENTSNATAPVDFILRGIAADANVIYAADKDGTTIYYSADGGVSRWQQRLNVGAAIADLAVESQNVIYYGNSINIFKSINNGFTWNLPVNTTMTSGSIYTILSLGENKLIVGGTTGSVIFSKDGATTWTKSLFGVLGGTNLQLAATGLESGNFIFAAPFNSKVVYRCEIGAANPTYEFRDMSLTSAFPASGSETTTGLVLASGVLYAISTNGDCSMLNSTLYPTYAGISHPAEAWRTQYTSTSYSSSAYYVFNRPPSALRASTSTGKVTLWGISMISSTNPLAAATAGTFGVRYFDDTLALTGPTISAPADKALVQANSVTGTSMAINLMWARPSLATGYEVSVALDSNFNSQVNIDGLSTTGYTDADAAADVFGSYATMSLIVPSPASVGLNPGSTYYWRVRASLPISSAWSETRSFTIQPMAAAVPGISSPVNGSTIINQSPAFSWTPVTSTTKYEFQLSTTPTFGTTVLTDTPASAGTLVPVTIKLEQGKQYFWRVRALEPVQGDWSTVANFIIALPATTAPPPVTVTNAPPVTITIPPASPVPAITLKPADVEQIAPTYIWAIIIIGAILVIAVIVLIVRTRRSV